MLIADKEALIDNEKYKGAVLLLVFQDISNQQNRYHSENK